MKQVIVVRTDLKMSVGKLATQVAHASLLAYKKAKEEKEEWVKKWEEEGEKKIVLKIGSEGELIELYTRVKGLPKALVRDAGLTQLKPGTPTCVAIGPAPDDLVDKYTGHLKLL